MGYYNPFMQYGEEKLVKECQEVGVHGLIVVDLLFDEAESLCPCVKSTRSTLFR